MEIYPDNSLRLSHSRPKNKITLNGKEFRIKYLSDNANYQKGGTSSLFLLVDLQEEIEDRVIKFCKCDRETHPNSNRVKRFEREIKALKISRKNQLSNIIKMFENGEYEINGKKIPFYVMEKAETDLTDFIIDGGLKDDIQGKVKLCVDLLKAMQQLHENDIYHRDLKPDNILLFSDGTWKICDLGLVKFRKEDELSWENTLIGPKGWITPEASNRYYTHENDTEFSYDTNINDYSDIFQLGKLFWFIFQTNIPIGRIHREDFKISDDQIYGLLIWMLNHSKKRRPSLQNLGDSFITLKTKYKI